MVVFGMSMVLPPCTKNWYILFAENCVTTLLNSISWALRSHFLLKGSEGLRELLGRVNSLSIPIEVVHTHSVGVKVTSIGIAIASKAIVRVRSATASCGADMVGIVLAWMGCYSTSPSIGL